MDKKQLEEAARVIWWAGYNAQGNTLSGYQTPRQQRYFDRSSNPQIGDMVIETSSKRHPYAERVGKLISITKDGSNDPLYEIEVLDGQIIEWGNARFIAVLGVFPD